MHEVWVVLLGLSAKSKCFALKDSAILLAYPLAFIGLNWALHGIRGERNTGPQRLKSSGGVLFGFAFLEH